MYISACRDTIVVCPSVLGASDECVELLEESWEDSIEKDKQCASDDHCDEDRDRDIDEVVGSWVFDSLNGFQTVVKELKHLDIFQ